MLVCSSKLQSLSSHSQKSLDISQLISSYFYTLEQYVHHKSPRWPGLTGPRATATCHPPSSAASPISNRAISPISFPVCPHLSLVETWRLELLPPWSHMVARSHLTG